jgi:LysM domain
MSSMVIEMKPVRGKGDPTHGVEAAGLSRQAAGGLSPRAAAGVSPRAECAHRPVRDAADTPPLRLTQRGRLVVVLAVLGLAYGAMTMMSAPAASTGQVRHVRAQTVVVNPGETLWDIAKSVAPGSDPRAVVADIVDLNALADPGAIRVGQPLDIPEE